MKITRIPASKRLPRRLAAVALGASLPLAGPLQAQDLATDHDARLGRLERMLGEQTLSDLVLQIQSLQQEVQELRGLVEMHEYRLQQVTPRFGSAPRVSMEPPRPLLPGDPGAGEDAATDTTPSSNADAPPALPGASARGGSGLLGLPAPETLGGGERDGYLEAFELLKARDYPAARTAFEGLLARYPEGQYADSARYWLGEIAYLAQDYPTAADHFSRLIRDHPASDKLATALLKLGYVYDEQEDKARARETLREVIARFPDSTEASLAAGRLERLR
ncbi:MAG: tol-pal system protein YbgF [Chromatiaceae bacterium]|nr:MAG: tol-pal system protein YbgF [Chromatiaceae bacterium]